MIEGALKKLQRSKTPQKYKDIGMTKAKLKPLIDMGLVKLVIIQNKKGTLKTPNSCVITKKGIIYVQSLNNPKLSVISDLNEVKNEVSNVNSSLSSINNLYSKISQTMNEVSSKLNKLEKKIENLDSSSSVSSLELQDIVDSYYKYKGKLSAVAPVRKVIKDLQLKTRLSIKEIELQLFEFHIRNKLTLIEGQGDHPLRTSDGDEYALIKLDW